MFQSFENIGVGAVQKHAAIRDAQGKDVNPCPNTEAGNHNSRVVAVAPLMNRNVIANVMVRKS
jgi:hypothetical protein